MRQFILTALYLFLFGVVTFVLVSYLLPYVLPFLLAVPLAAFIDPLVNFIENKGRLPRGVAAALVLFMVLVLAGAGLVLVFSRLAVEAVKLSHNLPQYYQFAVGLSDQLLAWFEDLFASLQSLPPSLEEGLLSALGRVYFSLQSLVANLLESITGLPYVVGRVVTVFAVTCLAAFFMCRDKKLIRAFILGWLPKDWREGALTLEGEVMGSIIGFVKAQMTIVCITAVLTTIGLSIIRVPYAFLLGLAAGILDLVPFLGPTAVFVPWIVYAFVVGNGVLGFKLLVLFLFLSLARQILEPKIIGDYTGVHPLATLFSIYLGIMVFGLWGFIIGPVTAVVLKAVARAGVFPGFTAGR
mgnify:CR=1 FL=1